MPVLKFKDENGIVKTVPDIRILKKMSDGGLGYNDNLNIHYGDTAPADTSKLWVKSSKPNSVSITPKIIGEKNTMTLNVAELPNSNLNLRLANVNGIIYIFDSSNTIRKFNPATEELTTLDIKLTSSGSYKTPVIIDKLVYIFPTSYKDPFNIFNTETETVIEMENWGNSSGDYIAIGNKIYQLMNNTNVYCYDTETGVLKTINQVITTYRETITLAVIGSKIYLLGGTRNNGGYVNSYTHFNTIHVFDTLDNSFTECSAQLPSNMPSASAVVVGTDIYMFGGYQPNSDKDESMIVVYDTINDTVRMLDTKISLSSTYKFSAVLCGTDIYFTRHWTDKIHKFSLHTLLLKNSMQIQTTASGSPIVKLMKNPELETSVKKIFIGNNNGYAEEIDSYIYGYVPERTFYENKKYTSSCVENSGTTSLNASVNCNVGDLIIVSIITRDTLTLSNGWTLISTSGTNSSYVSGNGQRLSFAYKYATATTETITVTQASSQRLYITMIALQGATGFVDNGYSYANSSSATSISVTKSNGLILFGCSADLWNSTSPCDLWTISDNSDVVQLGTSTQSRLGVILDQNESTDEIVITPGSSGTPLIVGSLTITGMDKFYDVTEWTGGEMWRKL